METDHLFSKYDLRLVIENQESVVCKEIDSMDANRLLNTDPESLSDYFYQKYVINCPQLKDQDVQVEQDEKQVDARYMRDRFFFDEDRPVMIKGTAITFYIPFEGDSLLFQCRASTWRSSPPKATIRESEIALLYLRTDHDAEKVKQSFQHDFQEIQEHLGWIAKDIEPFNNSLRGKALNKIQIRREKLLKDQGLVSNLGFPIRKRDNAPQTYTVPTKLKTVKPTMPPASTAPFVPEPTLDMQQYDHILSVISNMVIVMERSPKAFRDMGEEDLRQHFLVQLNGQYEGQASGETFNFEGKTDILIREQGKNIFIAECKFWRGAESLKEALDQLLGYASWRDTKTAILVFNRQKAFSSKLEKIPDIVKAHANFKRLLPYESETGFRFVLNHRDDPNRELILTVLAFEIPK